MKCDRAGLPAGESAEAVFTFSVVFIFSVFWKIQFRCFFFFSNYVMKLQFYLKSVCCFNIDDVMLELMFVIAQSINQSDAIQLI